MRQLRDTGTVPAGGFWRYVDPETQAVFKHPYLDQVRAQAYRHRLANNLPISTDWESQFEENVCSNTPTANCEDADPRNHRLIDLARRFTSAMARWAKSGFKLVDETTLVARKLTCEGDNTSLHPRCPNWYNSTRFFGFGRCGKCGCAGGLKTPLATEKCPLNRWPA